MTDHTTKGFVAYFLREYRRRTLLLVALLVCSGLAEGVGIAALLPVLELGTSPGSARSRLAVSIGEFLGSFGLQPSLGTLLIVLLIAFTVKGIFRWFAMRQVGFVIAQVGMDLRLRLIRALMNVQWGYFASRRTGHFANTIGREAFQAAGAYRHACSALAGATSVVVYAGVAALASWEIALAGILVGAGVVRLLRRLVAAARSAGAEQVEVMKSLVARLTEALPGLKPLKAMGRERYVLPLLEQEARGFYRAQQRQVQAQEALISFQEPLLVAALAAGLFGVMTYTATPFATVLIVSFLFHRIVNGINQVQQRYSDMVSGEASFWSILDMIRDAERAQEESTTGSGELTFDRAIELVGVSHSYGRHQVLDDVSVTIPRGSFTAIVGPSGSGKTTLADIVIGLLHQTKGTVQVDGRSLADIGIAEWRSRIGYVPQEPLLFHDSIAKNVTLGNTDIPTERVVEALKQAGAYEFVSGLPDGLDSLVGEHGSTLSGGQRQRIAIARALVERPRLLVLDEATTALDPETEAAVCRTLAGLKGDITILSISHQMAMREVADIVYEVEGGQVRVVSGQTV
jgi:ATP-binding cassette subfamily C protein